MSEFRRPCLFKFTFVSNVIVTAGSGFVKLDLSFNETK